MFRTLVCCVALFVELICVAQPVPAQTAAPDANTPVTTMQSTPVIAMENAPSSTLRINSRSVLVDVVVTDKSGKPVTGLKQDAFTVMEQGKPQTIGYFEEHTAAPLMTAPQEMPKYPPDVFSNFSPFPQPAAVNVLLLDSLNTRMEDQAVVHQQALKFLKSAKPGTRMAIFTMGLGLHFIQGFNDDPAVLAAAVNNKKNNEVQSSEMLKGQEESNAQSGLVGMMSAPAGNGGTVAPQAMITALQSFMNENDSSQAIDEGFITLANVQRLAAFLEGFPGRKNIIWFAERMPSVFITGSGGTNNPALADEIQKTLAMLASARAAIYPVYARGVSVDSLYTAENNLSHGITQGSQLIGPNGAFTQSLGRDESERNSEIASAQILAEQSGGRAFATNGMSDVMKKVTTDSSYFYTLSYSPTNAKMDGSFRTVEVKIPSEKYHLSYRQGYFAMDTALPGSAMSFRNHAIQKLAAQNPGAVDPLLPFMDLAMPQSQQILYKVRIVPGAAGEGQAAEQKGKDQYKVDFAVDLKDLYLKGEWNGQHKGALNVSLIVYDRYGNVVSRENHVAQLNLKPDVYAIFENTGVQLHAELAVPKGQYWLRTGVYDQGSHKVGTMEVALSSVVPLEATPLEASIPLRAPVPMQTETKEAESQSARIAVKVTLEQLEHTLAAAHKKRDQDLAKLLGDMELSERLDSEKLAKMQAELPGDKSRAALLVLGDASAFLQPPFAEIPTKAAPDAHTQNVILAKAAENLMASINKMPDFFARQTTNRFHDLKISYLSPVSAPVVVEHQGFRPLDSFSNTVYYRSGKEVEEAKEDKYGRKIRPKNGLLNWGVFGQLQRIVVTDIYKGKMEWGRWEERSTGPVAVFKYSIPKDKSNYIVSYCCIGLPNEPWHDFQSIPPFHGEIAIDAATGAVYRLLIVTELGADDPILQADIVVEYEPVEIGGQMYVCPRKSVTITTAISAMGGRSGCSGSGTQSDCVVPVVYGPKDTAINDTVYDSYHVFRSEARIITDADAGQEDKTLPDGAVPATTTAPRP